MNTIYKYELYETGLNTIHLPVDADVLHVGVDPMGRHCMWARVNTDSPKHNLEVLVIGTGQTIPQNTGKHIGTFVDAMFVWHVFTLKP